MSQGSEMNLPPEVVEYVRSIFAGCNDRVSEKLSRMPTTHETSLDLSLIESISQFAAPQRVGSNWVVRLDTHYLGGGRHFGEWEIADVGFIIVFRRRGVVQLRKVAVLQSKRLYPDEQAPEEDTPLDYMIGFGRLMQGDEIDLAAMEERTFHFAESSVYRQLKVDNRQYQLIREYEAKYSIPVHYLLYHPLTIPWSQVIPVSVGGKCLPERAVGGWVVRARDLRSRLDGRPAESSPSYRDISDIGPWPIQNFVADELLGCREGYRAQGPEDPELFQIFNRRAGPIAAAIAITIDEL